MPLCSCKIYDADYVEEKTALKEHKLSTAASNKKELAATTASKAEDESTLGDIDIAHVVAC